MARGGARPGAGRPAGKSANTSPPATRARAHARGYQLGEQVDRHARAAKRRIPAHDLAYQPILGRRLGSSGLAGQGAGDASVLKNNQRKSNGRG